MFNADATGGGFFGDAGGYGASTTPKSGGKGDQNKRAQNVLPVTTRQIRNSGESGVRIADNDFYLVTLVGRVVEINTSSLKITYVVEDDRGTVEAVQWLEQDGDNSKSTVVENVYCRVYGSIRSEEDKKFLMVFSITPIKSLNEVTTHHLEVAVVPKKLEVAAKKLGSVQTSDMGGGGLGNSLMDMGYSRAPMSGLQKQVIQIIKGFQDPGVHVNNINNYLTEKVSQAQINKVCEDLMNEGHIYSTIDEYHYLSTEN